MRVSKTGRTVHLEVRFWWDESDQAIHLTHGDPEGPKSFHVAVRADGTKPSGQPYLFRELAKCLRQMGASAPPADPEAQVPVK